MREYRKEHQVGTVTAIETGYASGLVEIGFYLPAAIPSAGPVLAAVADRMPGNRHFWLHGRRNREARAPTIRAAVAAGAILAERAINRA